MEVDDQHQLNRDSTNGILWKEELLAGIRWLIFLRWFAIGGLIITVSLSYYVFHVIALILPLLLIVGFMGIYNIMYWWALSWLKRQSYSTLQRYAFLQILLDIICLTLLLHFSGGVENPFVLYFTFHMTIASILLHRNRSYLLAGIVTALFSIMAFLEYIDILTHHSLMIPPYMKGGEGMWKSNLYLLGILISFGSTMFGAVYFATAIMQRLRRSFKEQVQLQGQLARQEKLALLGELSAGVAHEINSPLSGVLNCLSVVQERLGEISNTSEIVTLMKEGLERVTFITERLLFLSREHVMRNEWINVNKVIEESLPFVEYRLRKQQIYLEKTLDPNLPQIYADPHCLSEVILNLFTNALDAINKGGKIGIFTRKIRDDTNTIQIIVEDNGCGIPKENLPRIFSPFFTTKEVGKGTGVGLTICKRIVEEHEGTIRVESQKESGTRVFITLPIEQEKTIKA